jgi:hypothetical protein
MCFLGAAGVVAVAIIVTLTSFLETTTMISKATREKELLLTNVGYQSGIIMSALPIDPIPPTSSGSSYTAVLWEKLNPFVPIATLFSNAELRVSSACFSYIQYTIYYWYIKYSSL